MRTPSLLLAAVGLLLMGFLIARGDNTVGPESVTPSSATNTLPRGLYVRGGLTFLLDDGRFQLDTPHYPASSSGTAAMTEGQLVLDGIKIRMNCSFAVIGDHLWLGVLRRGRGGVFRSGNCDPLASTVDITWNPPTGAFTITLDGRRVVAPSTVVSEGRLFPQFEPADRFTVPFGEFRVYDDVVKTPWSVDLGAVGLLPLPGISAVGTWTSLDGEQVTVSAGPSPAGPAPPPFFSARGLRQPWSATREQSQLRWPPSADARGYSSEAFTVDHYENHGDSDLMVTWVPLSVNEALRIVTGGCGADPRPRHQRFWRVLP